MTTEAEFLNAYERIKSSYECVIQEIEVAVACEEQKRPMEAIAGYERCIERIESVFALPVGLPEDIDAVTAQWTDACQLIQKLKNANTEMAYRLKVLRARHAPIDVEAAEGGDATEQPQCSPLHDNPCTQYDIHTASSTTKTYREIIGGLRKLMATQLTGVVFDTLFQAQGKLYKIYPDGVVTAIAGNTTMSMVMCTVDAEWSYLNGICFIQSSMEETTALSSTADSINKLIWLYPLIPTVTVCYRTEYGAIILPDLESNLAGTAFGIMLFASNEAAASSTGDAAAKMDDELSDKQQFLLNLLEAVLAGTVEELKQPTRRAAGSQQVSRRIVCAADFISRQLVWGAEKTGQLMVKTTPYFMARMQPAASDAPPVSSALQSSVEVARSVTGVAVGVTGWVAGKVGAASMAVGRFLSPHIQTQGAILLQKGLGYDCTEANDTIEGAMTIAAGAVEGVYAVYNGLETSAKILGTNLSQNSVKIIEYKYGPSAGNVAAGTFDTIGNAFNVSQNVNYMTPKGIAKKMVKNTGKAVVNNYQRTLRSADAHIVPAGLLYHDLRSIKENSKR